MPEVPADIVNKIYQERRQKYAHRMEQGRKVREVLTGKLETIFKDVVRADQEPVVGNLIIAAGRTIAQRVGRSPRLDVQPVNRDDDPDLKKAEAHERRLVNYGLQMNIAATRLQAAFWLVCHDLAPLVVTPSSSYGIPVIEVRDPLTCYPGIVWPHKPDTVNVLFADRMTSWAAGNIYPQIRNYLQTCEEQVENVVIGEFFDADGLTVVMLEPSCMNLTYYPNPVEGHPQVVLTRGFSPDLDFHGQFDHVVAPLVAQAKLFALVMTYASQQVAAETVVVGEISSNQGKWATGPGAVNTITPMPGAQANKLTNNMSIQVFNELDRLERAIRLGGQFPAQLSGEPNASIATGKGMEQLTLTVDDNVSYWQNVLDDAFMRCYTLITPMAQAMGSEGFQDLSKDNVIYVKSLSGADPAETVRLLQLQGARNISRYTVMDRLPEIDAPMKEMQRLDVDDMRSTLIRALDMQIQTGQVQADTIAKLIQRRKKGDNIEDIWEEIQKEQAAQQQQAQQDVSQVQQQGAPGQPPPGQAPPLDQMLSPQNTLKGVPTQMERMGRTQSPMFQQGAAGNMAGTGPPPPGGQTPGPAGVPT